MADFILLTRRCENSTTGEMSNEPILVNLAHVRNFIPIRDGGTWINWAEVAAATRTRVVEDFDAIAAEVRAATP